MTDETFTQPIILVASSLALSLLPIILMSMTSYLKFSIVFTALRSAVGGGNIPPISVVGLLSLALSVFVMAPVFSDSWQRFESYLPLPKNIAAEFFIRVGADVLSPLVEFTRRNTGDEERKFFVELARENSRQYQSVSASGPNKDKSETAFIGNTTQSVRIVIPAFILTELKEAFILSLGLLMPFLAVDIIVSNILVAVGVVMLSPSVVSLPLKILLFVAVDGWSLLSQSLVLGYVQG
ncbi:MAG: flagellar type III secretion system pore protein FliP [bacterium]|nr:flagellar type III secretion system pore protein FliP [bacterium]